MSLIGADAAWLEVCAAGLVAALVVVLDDWLEQESAEATIAASKTILRIKMPVRIAFDRLVSMFPSFLIKSTRCYAGF